jgi:hypothetical protein
MPATAGIHGFLLTTGSFATSQSPGQWVLILAMMRDILPQRIVDPRLVSLAVRRPVPEPGDQIRINPQRKLLFDGPEKQAAPRAAPIFLFRNAARV